VLQSLKYTVFVLLGLFMAGHTYAQDSVTIQTAEPTSAAPETQYIRWVSQYPAQRASEVKENAAKKIFNFLVQKDRQAGISRPVAVVANAPGSFWVLDQGAQTILDIEKKKTLRPRQLRKKDNYFTSLVGACAMPGGKVIFTDSRLNKVFIISDEEKKLQELADTFHFQQPTGVAYSSVTDEIWVVETGAHRISVFSHDGRLLRQIGERGNGPAQFNFPTSISIDKNGDAYVVDAMNFRVQIFNKAGQFVTAFGEPGDAGGSFARPKGIATDSYGNIYVSDALFHAVQIFDRKGNFLYSFGKQGREQGEFWMPAGLFIDSHNNIYVADSYNSRVQVFQLINRT